MHRLQLHPQIVLPGLTSLNVSLLIVLFSLVILIFFAILFIIYVSVQVLSSLGRFKDSNRQIFEFQTQNNPGAFLQRSQWPSFQPPQPVICFILFFFYLSRSAFQDLLRILSANDENYSPQSEVQVATIQVWPTFLRLCLFFRHHTATLVTSDTFILFIFSYSLAFDQVMPITFRASTLLSYTVCPAVWQIELKSAVFERPFGCRLRLTLIISCAFPDLYLCNSNTKFFFSGFPTVPAIFL